MPINTLKIRLFVKKLRPKKNDWIRNNEAFLQKNYERYIKD